MALGSVKHNKRKIGKAARNATGLRGNKRDFNVRVRVERTRDSYSPDATGEYVAHACVAARGSASYTHRHSTKRCSDNFYGKSPTALAKKALRDLAKTLK